ncbi:RluA family pseudouridine synthase [Salsuginibacillus kocurii]|uniref:RluA family pseudouridine synthase n=1 Tax=Salsuginibacillus kocurii TaxID=427078 RepID=UPI00037D65FE|nr:RluA family pseudouridine synthase [Salsuginibacillus kocurii]
MKDEQLSLVVSQEGEGERLDKHIVALFPDWSRSTVQKWAKEGHVQVNNKSEKSNYKLKAGDQVTVTPPAPEHETIEPENVALDVLYEDEELLVVNKPRGMVVHPAPGHTTGTLVNALLHYTPSLSTLNGDFRPGIVHRLDKDTSGLLVVAKTDYAHEQLADQLREKKAERLYKAIVHGVIAHQRGTIEAPIGRDPNDRQKMAVTDQHGKEATTHFEVEERFNSHSLLTCQLETGRTHQIRVHLAYINHPVVKDPKYGPKSKFAIRGQALHAETLAFVHPATKEFMKFQAPFPDDFTQVLTQLRMNA